jgi:hypothetical protein
MPRLFRARVGFLSILVLLLLVLPRYSAGFSGNRQVPDVPITPPAFAANRDTLAQTFSGAALETLPGGYVLASPPSIAPVHESRRGNDFTQACLLYVPKEVDQRSGLYLTVAVYHADADRELARRSARLSARLLRLFQERFGQEAVFPRAAPTARVYVLPPRHDSPTIGGETFSSAETYLYLSGVERTPLEQVRTLVHEWGHLTIPGARGYSEPETDAAGYLGERIYMKWLRETTGGANDGTSAADLNVYYQRQIAPLLLRYAVGGPASKRMDGTQTAHMDYYIAAALAFDEAFGSRLLGRALFSIDGVAPRDLLAAMRSTVSNARTLTIRLPAWVPVPSGRYTVASNAPGSVVLTSRKPVVLPSGKPLTVTFPSDTGWRLVRTASGSVRTLNLRRLSEAAL